MDNLFYNASGSGILQAAASQTGGPKLSADFEEDMLHDYWVVHNLGLKKVHEKKLTKRTQPRLGPLNKLSQSMSALPLNNNKIGASPIKPGRSGKKDPSEDSVDDMKLDTDSVEPFRVNEIMSRVTFGGKEGGEVEGGHSLEELATHGREIQYDTLKESVVMNQVMREVLALHGTLGEVVQELHSRHDISARVDLANHTYVRLFERMLGEVLRMQRDKFKSTAKTMLQLKQDLAAVRSREAAGRDRVFAANTEAAQAGMTVAGLKSDLQNAENEVERLSSLVRELEDDNRQLKTTIEVNGQGVPPREVKRLIKEARQDEVLKALKEKSKERAKFLKETEAKIKEALDKSKVESKSLSELTEEAKKANDFKRPKVDSSSQTEIDEFGIWDKTDGWNMPISGTVLARRRWRDAIKYAKCPKCKGTGDFLALCARLLKSLVRGMPVLDEDASPRGKNGSVWVMPDDLVRFMSNLPRSVQATSPRPLGWVLRRVWVLCHEKKTCDDTDQALGYAIQSTPEFLIEHYLRLMPVRSEAEFALYELLTSLQENYKAHPLLHIFARFVGILDGLSAEELVHRQKDLLMNKKLSLEKKQSESLKSMGVREKTAYKAAAQEKQIEDLERQAGRAAAEATLKMCDCSLTSAAFTVFHFARSCILETYTGAYATKIAMTKASVPLLMDLEAKLDKESGEWPMHLPAHICLDSKFRFYVPIDRAVRVLSVLLSFMEEGPYQAALRTMEGSAVFLNPDGSLYLLDGMHSLVRSQMREFLLAESDDGSDLTFMQVYEQQKAAGRAPLRDDEELGPMTEEELEKDKPTIMVDLDVCLRVVAECMALRTKYVENKLAEIFIQGDDNGDGVLSFKEFTTIVAVVAPHFNERRIIRMFREALMFGSDDDSISSHAFVVTCKGHNLVQLIDVRQLRSGLLKALCLTDEQKHARNQLIADQKAALEAQAALARSTFQTPSQRRASVLQSALARRGSVAQGVGGGSLSFGGGSVGSLGSLGSMGGTSSPNRRMSLAGVAKGAAFLAAARRGSVAHHINSNNSMSGGSTVVSSTDGVVDVSGRGGGTTVPAPALPVEVTSGSSIGEREEGSQRLGTAGSPMQLALVDLYAQAVGGGDGGCGGGGTEPSGLGVPASVERARQSSPITRPMAQMVEGADAGAEAEAEAEAAAAARLKASLASLSLGLARAQAQGQSPSVQSPCTTTSSASASSASGPTNGLGPAQISAASSGLSLGLGLSLGGVSESHALRESDEDEESGSESESDNSASRSPSSSLTSLASVSASSASAVSAKKATNSTSSMQGVSAQPEPSAATAAAAATTTATTTAAAAAAATMVAVSPRAAAAASLAAEAEAHRALKAAFIPRASAASGISHATAATATSRQTAEQVKEQLRLRREGRLRQKVLDARVGRGGDLNDSDEEKL